MMIFVKIYETIHLPIYFTFCFKTTWRQIEFVCKNVTTKMISLERLEGKNRRLRRGNKFCIYGQHFNNRKRFF